MKKILATAVAVGAVMTAFTAPAHAADPQGRKCGFTSGTDVTAEPDTQSGVAHAGPLLFDGPGTLSCQMYVNGTLEARADAHSADVAAGVSVAAVAKQIAFHSVPGDADAECTVYTYDDGRVIYWHASSSPVGGTWDPAPIVPANCAQAITIDPNPEACPVLLAIDARTVPLGAPSLAQIWQDCDPYRPII